MQDIYDDGRIFYSEIHIEVETNSSVMSSWAEIGAEELAA